MQVKRVAGLCAIGIVTALLPAAPATMAEATGPLDGYRLQKPVWKRCDPDSPRSYECAKIKVPLDYRKPDGKKIQLAVSRIRTSTPGKRRGVLLFNPGGPGAAGLKWPLLMKWDLPKSVQSQYDLVGFDPRGVGESTPITCGLKPEEQGSAPRPYKPETFNKDVAWSQAVADKCRRKAGDKIQHITTRNTARDMDIVRSVLGEKKISYVGYSYGTYLGAVYSQMFPSRVDRLVLDSAVDPKRIWRGMTQVWASAAEPAFTRWTQWAAQRAATYKLGVTPAEVRKTFWDLVTQANRKPIKTDGETYTGDLIRAQRDEFFAVQRAAEWVRDLKRASESSPAARSRTARGPLTQSPAEDRWGNDDNNDAVFWAVTCGDTASWPRDPRQYRDDAVRDKKRYPLYGDYASNIKPCAFWPANLEPETTVGNSTKALIIQNEWDPQTPMEAATGLHRLLKSSRMLTVKGGEGHVVSFNPPRTPCADKAVSSYLTTGQLPTHDITCQDP